MADKAQWLLLPEFARKQLFEVLESDYCELDECPNNNDNAVYRGI